MALNYAAEDSVACTSFNSLAASTTTGVACSAPHTTSTTNNVVDSMVTVTIDCGAHTASATTNIIVWAVGSYDGTTWAGATTGTVETFGADSAETIDVDGNNMKFLGTIHCHTSDLVYVSNPMSIAAAFGGILPKKTCIVIQNQTGTALATSGHSVKFTDIYYN